VLALTLTTELKVMMVEEDDVMTTTTQDLTTCCNCLLLVQRTKQTAAVHTLIGAPNTIPMDGL